MIENFFKKGTPDTLLSTGLIKRNLKIENDKSLQGFRDYSMTLKKAFNTIVNEKRSYGQDLRVRRIPD